MPPSAPRTEACSARPLPYAQLCDARFDLDPCNHALYWANVATRVHGVRERLDRDDVRCREHVRYMAQALGRARDRGFYATLERLKAPFCLRYAWLFARLLNCGDGEVNLVYPTGLGFRTVTLVHHDGDCGLWQSCCGVAEDKAEVFRVLLQGSPLPFAPSAADMVKALECAHEASRLVTEPQKPLFFFYRNSRNLQPHLASAPARWWRPNRAHGALPPHIHTHTHTHTGRRRRAARRGPHGGGPGRAPGPARARVRRAPGSGGAVVFRRPVMVAYGPPRFVSSTTPTAPTSLASVADPPATRGSRLFWRAAAVASGPPPAAAPAGGRTACAWDLPRQPRSCESAPPAARGRRRRTPRRASRPPSRRAARPAALRGTCSWWGGMARHGPGAPVATWRTWPSARAARGRRREARARAHARRPRPGAPRRCGGRHPGGGGGPRRRSGGRRAAPRPGRHLHGLRRHVHMPGLVARIEAGAGALPLPS